MWEPSTEQLANYFFATWFQFKASLGPFSVAECTAKKTYCCTLNYKGKNFLLSKEKTLSYLCCCCSFSSLCRDPAAAVQERSPFTLLALHTLLYTLTRISSMRCFIMHLVLNIAGQCFFMKERFGTSWQSDIVPYTLLCPRMPRKKVFLKRSHVKFNAK